MLDTNNIHSLTDFNRNTREHIARLKETGKPEVLTVNGKAEVVVQDAAAYQKLLDDLDYQETVEGIRQGLDSIERGEGKPMREFLENLAAKKGIELKNS